MKPFDELTPRQKFFRQNIVRVIIYGSFLIVLYWSLASIINITQLNHQRIKAAALFEASKMVNTEVILNFFLSIASGAVGGLIVWLVQKRNQEGKEALAKHESYLIRPRNTEKEITSSILNDLRPGNSIEMMKDMLGVPMKFSITDFPLFTESSLKTSSYLYSFKNCNLKVTSEDNLKIDSITVFPYDMGGKKFEIEEIFFPSEPNSRYLNEIILDDTLIQDASNHELIRTRIDRSFALQYYSGSPFYQYYTLFGYAPDDSFEYHETKDSQLFKGGEVNGICISDSASKSFFIYHYELF